MRPFHFVVTCEHGGHEVPRAFEYLFSKQDKVLLSHRGWDPGALTAARLISSRLQARLFETEVTRLLVDCNRSRWNADLFSEFSQGLATSVKEYIVNQYYEPYRKKVEKYIINHAIQKPVLHLSVHSFTPVLHGVERMVDVGLLFDSSREQENRFCEAWQQRIADFLSDKLILLNVPYNGADDGLTTHLRGKLPADRYLGIEIEINQKWQQEENLIPIVSAVTDALEFVTRNFLGHNYGRFAKS